MHDSDVQIAVCRGLLVLTLKLYLPNFEMWSNALAGYTPASQLVLVFFATPGTGPGSYRASPAALPAPLASQLWLLRLHPNPTLQRAEGEEEILQLFPFTATWALTWLHGGGRRWKLLCWFLCHWRLNKHRHCSCLLKTSPFPISRAYCCERAIPNHLFVPSQHLLEDIKQQQLRM